MSVCLVCPWRCLKFSRLLHGIYSSYCWCSPKHPQSPISMDSSPCPDSLHCIFTCRLSQVSRTHLHNVHRIGWKCLGLTAPITTCDSPYPMSDRYEGIDSSVPLPLDEGNFEAWLYITSQSFLTRLSFSHWLWQLTWWHTLPGQLSLPGLILQAPPHVLIAPKHIMHTQTLIREGFCRKHN